MRSLNPNQKTPAIAGPNVRKGRSRKFSAATLGNGLSHPPKNRVTAIEETAIMLAYSARKNREKRNPLYSVWKPATSSDSASGRSNGARLFDAKLATKYAKNARNANGLR